MCNRKGVKAIFLSLFTIFSLLIRGYSYTDTEYIDTVCRGIKYNDSLVKNVKANFVFTENWQAEFSVCPNMIKHKIVDLFWVSEGEKVKYVRKAWTPDRDKRIGIDKEWLYDGEKVVTRRIMTDGNFMVIISDDKERLREGPDPEMLDLSNLGEMIEKALREQRVTLNGKEIIEGVSCDILEIIRNPETKEVERRVWVAPEMGCRIFKQEWDIGGGLKKIDKLIYKEFTDGARFPIEGRISFFGNPTLPEFRNLSLEEIKMVEYVMSTKDIELNTSLPQEIFSIALPSGTWVVDERLGIDCTVP